MSQIIDGKAAAAELRSNVSSAVNELRKHHQLVPGLAVVMVGDDPASQIYTQNVIISLGLSYFFLTIPLKTVKRYTTDDRGEEEEEEEMRN